MLNKGKTVKFYDPIRLKPSSTDLDSIYKTTFLHSPDFCFVVDKENVLLSCNQNLLNFLKKKSIDDINDIYQAIEDAGHWHNSHHQMQTIKTQNIELLTSNAVQNNEPSEFTLVADDTTVSYYQISQLVLTDEHQNIVALRVTLKDLTLQKRLKMQIANIEEEILKLDLPNSTFFSITKHPDKEQSTRVLLIEDNKTAQFAVQRIFLETHAQVDVIDSESELRKIYENGKYDLVLMDVELNKTNGLLLSKVIRKYEKNTNFHVPIILLTSYETNQFADECQFYRLEGVLAKPLTKQIAKQLLEHFAFHKDVPVFGLKYSQF